MCRTLKCTEGGNVQGVWSYVPEQLWAQKKGLREVGSEGKEGPAMSSTFILHNYIHRSLL